MADAGTVWKSVRSFIWYSSLCAPFAVSATLPRDQSILSLILLTSQPSNLPTCKRSLGLSPLFSLDSALFGPNGALPTPLPSITSALFPMQRGWWGSHSLRPSRKTLSPLISDHMSSTWTPLYPVYSELRGSTCVSQNPGLASGRPTRVREFFSTLSAICCRLWTPPNPLECAVPRFRALTPLECAVPKTPRRNSFRMRSSEERWGGGVPSGTESPATPMERESPGERGQLVEEFLQHHFGGAVDEALAHGGHRAADVRVAFVRNDG
jgi:hypothetical protein